MFIFSLGTVDKNTTPQPNSGVTTHLERGGGSITPSKMAEICFRKVQVKSMFWQDDCLRGMSQWHRLINCWCNPLSWFGNCWQRIQTHRCKAGIQKRAQERLVQKVDHDILLQQRQHKRMENGIFSKFVSGFLSVFNIWRKLVAK